MFVELHCQGMQHRGFIKAKVQVARRTLKMTHKQCSVPFTHSPVCTRSSSLLTGTKQLVMTHHFLLLTWVISLWQHIRLVWEFVGVHSCGSVWLGRDRWQQVLSFGADSSAEGSSFSLISGPLAPPHTVAKVSLKHPRPSENECVNESWCCVAGRKFNSSIQRKVFSLQKSLRRLCMIMELRLGPQSHFTT